MKKYFMAVPKDLCYMANCLVRIQTNDIGNQNMFGAMIWEDIDHNTYSCSSFVSNLNFLSLQKEDVVLGSAGGDLETALISLDFMSATFNIEHDKINVYEYEDLHILLSQLNLSRIYIDE